MNKWAVTKDHKRAYTMGVWWVYRMGCTKQTSIHLGQVGLKIGNITTNVFYFLGKEKWCFSSGRDPPAPTKKAFFLGFWGAYCLCLPRTGRNLKFPLCSDGTSNVNRLATVDSLNVQEQTMGKIQVTNVLRENIVNSHGGPKGIARCESICTSQKTINLAQRGKGTEPRQGKKSATGSEWEAGFAIPWSQKPVR